MPNYNSITITSTKNHLIKLDSKLKKRRYRDSTSCICVEGIDEVRTCIEAGVLIERLYYCPEYLRSDETDYLSRFQQIANFNSNPNSSILFVSAQVMRHLAYRERPDAWFAVARWSPMQLSQLPRPSQLAVDKNQNIMPLYLVASSVEKPGNIGAILRSAEAAACAAFIHSSGICDLRNPNIVRASKASLFILPTSQASDQECYEWLKDNGIQIAIAEPENAVDFWDIELPLPLACVIGAEKEGIPEFWKKKADFRIQIPMRGRINSLNLAQSATIIMYEIFRRSRNILTDQSELSSVESLEQWL